jgi:hypothetical protein
MKWKIPSLLWETIERKTPERACNILYPTYCPVLSATLKTCGECQVTLSRAMGRKISRTKQNINLLKNIKQNFNNRSFANQQIKRNKVRKSEQKVRGKCLNQ